MSRSQIAKLLERSTPGGGESVQRHISRCERLYGLIQDRHTVGSPWQIQAKHLRSALEQQAREVAPTTAYHYWRSARAWAAAIGRWPAWEPHLRGPWSPDGPGGGGRPAKVARR